MPGRSLARGRRLARGNSPVIKKGVWSVDILAVCTKASFHGALCSVVFDGVGLYRMGLYRMDLYGVRYALPL